MSDADAIEEFVKHLTENQNRIYAYIYSLLADHVRAADVLQETNLVLWRKNGEFLTGKPFIPWAFGIARLQVLANIRDKGRERFLLDESLVNQIADSAEVETTEFDLRRTALRHCMQQLTDHNRDILKQRYFGGKSIRELATIFDRGESAVKVALMRIRKSLLECIRLIVKESR